MPWYKLREGPLITYGGLALLGMIALLTVFYFIRGRIKIDGGPAGTTIERFKAIERFGHWLLAGSFIALGITGLITLMGRSFLIPVLGPGGLCNSGCRFQVATQQHRLGLYVGPGNDVLHVGGTQHPEQAGLAVD